MFQEATQRKVGWLVSLSVFSVTIFVTPFFTLDPINVPKLWALLAFSFAILAVLLLDLKALFQRSNRAILLAGLAVIVSMIVAMLVSNAPLSQQLFGASGRNTGLFTYIALSILFMGTALATDIRMAKYFLIATSGAIGFNAIYGAIQAVGSDPIKWANPYAPVIGTLGNPNFAAAFLGMGVGVTLPFLIHSGTKPIFRIASLGYIAVALFAITKSDAQQGVIVSLLSAGLVGFFFLRSEFKNKLISYGYLSLGGLVTLIGILGTLQKGPLSSILYKPSVTYRGDYWHAGLVMFQNHPIFGVGLDSYGDWYRASRTVEATLRRGPSTVSNAAHNVFIDFASTAGIFALIAYLAVVSLGFRAAWRIIKRSKNFDPFVVAVIVAWIGYLVQSVISINNIALAIWGWVLPGLVIAIDRWTQSAESKNGKVEKQTDLRNKNQAKMDFSGMAVVAGFVIGAVIGFFPFNSDANFRHSIEAGNADMIYSAAQKWPTDANRLVYAAKLFDENKLPEKATELFRKAAANNPRSFDAWYAVYQIPSNSANEKREILDRLKALDPHNPDLAKLG